MRRGEERQEEERKHDKISGEGEKERRRRGKKKIGTQLPSNNEARPMTS